MKKTKLSLKDIRVNSFVTSLDKQELNKFGGAATQICQSLPPACNPLVTQLCTPYSGLEPNCHNSLNGCIDTLDTSCG